MSSAQSGNTGARAFKGLVTGARKRGWHSPTGPRARILLRVIFRAMPGQLNRERAQGVEAKIQWSIADRKGNNAIWGTEISDGRCTVAPGPIADPRMKVELSMGDFLALASGAESGAALLFAGRLRIEGDLMLAASLGGLFGASM